MTDALNLLDRIARAVERASPSRDQLSVHNPLGGAKSSGVATAIAPLGPNPGIGSNVRVLNANQDGQGEGLAVVSVNVTPALPLVTGDAAYQWTILTVAWQNGRAGGQCEVDATNGTVFTVSAAQALTIDARVERLSFNVPPNSPQNMRVEASVVWWGAFSPRAATMVRKVDVPGGAVASADVAIPARANGVRVFFDDVVAAEDPGTFMQVLNQNTTFPLYQARITNGLLVPLSAGAGTITLTSAPVGAVVATLFFDLWL